MKIDQKLSTKTTISNLAKLAKPQSLQRICVVTIRMEIELHQTCLSISTTTANNGCP